MEKIGKYRVVRKLGEGASSEVYLCHDPFANREVAIKVVFPDSLIDADNRNLFKKLFITEASLAGKLTHPHIVQIHDAVADEGISYVVMEYVDGGTLEPHCNSGALLPLNRIVEIIFKCTRALDFANRAGVIHRDIKPANILLHGETDIKISDFGAALITTSMVTQVSGIGSPAYMSPQQIKEHPLTLQTDIYSLGVVMFQMATGRLPFLETAHVQVMMAHLTTQPPLPTAIAPQTPKPLERLILRCLAKAPAERFQSMAALQDALHAAMAECGLEADGESLQGATVPSLEAAPARRPLEPPAIPPMGSGLEGEPLPGAEMFEALEAAAPAPVDAFARAAGEEPFSRVTGTASVLEGTPGQGTLELAIAPRPVQPVKPLKPMPPLLAESEPLELDLPPPGEKSPYAALEQEEEQPLGAGVLGEVPQPRKRSAGGVLLALGLVACVGVVVLVLADKPGAPAPDPAREPKAQRPPPPPVLQQLQPSGAGAPAARAQGAPQGAAPAVSPAPAAAAKLPPLTCPPNSAQGVGDGPAVTLQIRSVPDGAEVRAQWPGRGCKLGVSPLLVEVPKGALVHLTLRAEGLATHDFEVPADSSHLIVETLAE